MSDEYRIDSHKLMFHPRRVARWAESNDDWKKARGIYPIYVEISPFGNCNHRCTFCAMDFLGYKANALDFEVMRQRIPEMAALGVKSVMFAGEGEPLLYQHINELTDLANDAGLDTAFTTNGVKLTGQFVESTMSRVSWIKVSFNAGTAETYSRIHRTSPDDYRKVINNIQKAVRRRQENNWPVTIGLQILLLPENAHEVETLAALCRDEIGVDYLVVKPYSQHHSSITQKYKDINYHNYINLAEKLETFNSKHFKVFFRSNTMRKHAEQERRYDRCHATPFFWSYIMANGDVYSCSAYLGDENFRLGNLQEKTFEEIWAGERRKKNLLHLQNTLNITDCRTNCRMDEVNQYLWQLKNPTEHVNFI